jgi:hypothetical protein
MYTTVQILRNIIYAAAARGGNLQKLTRAAGLQSSQLQDSEHQVEGATAIINLWKEVLSVTGDHCFGLHLGEQYNPSMLGLLGYLIQSCRTIGDAYQHLETYQELVSGWITYKMETSKGRCEVVFGVNRTWLQASPDTARQAVEMAMSGSLMSHKILTERLNSPIFAELSYPRTAALAEYERIFGCPVFFGKENNKFVFDAAFIDRPINNYNQSLYITFNKMLKEKAEVIANTQTFADQLQRTIIRDFKGGHRNLRLCQHI